MQIDRWDYASMGDYLHTSDDLKQAMKDAAEYGASIVKDRAPVGNPPDDKHPGAYKDAVHAELGTGGLDDRIASRIVAGADYSAALEWGNKRIRAQYILTGSLDLLGGE